MPFIDRVAFCTPTLSLFFVFVIGFIIFTGILSLKEHVIAGILLISIGVFMLVVCIRKMMRKDR